MNIKCQVFTPTDIVINMLDSIGYDSNIFGKKVIENACGDGNILQEIVRRYIQDGLNNQHSLVEIKEGLENDIYGAEIDKVHYWNCIRNLNSLVSNYGISNVSWNILNLDILKHSFNFQFDYVIGNPPYISYNDLDSETRLFLKNNFTSCEKGKFDYYYAFIEKSIDLLNSNGKLIYLIPNNFFKNVSGKRLRELVLPFLTDVYDYTTHKLFKNVLTSSSIICLNKSTDIEKFNYHDVTKKRKYVVNKNHLFEKWIFSPKLTSKEIINDHSVRFGDYFQSSISIATLYNKAFVIKDYYVTEEYAFVNEYKIEKQILKKAYSPNSLRLEKNELIIFPYFYDEFNNLKRYSPEDFVKRFPYCAEYLKQFKEQLLERDSDVSSQWYEFGRSQALQHLNQPKLLLSTLVTKHMKIYELDISSIPYSGIYIVPKKDATLHIAKKILNSEDFHNYVLNVGINVNGNSIRISSTDINNYMFNPDLHPELLTTGHGKNY